MKRLIRTISAYFLILSLATGLFAPAVANAAEPESEPVNMEASLTDNQTDNPMDIPTGLSTDTPAGTNTEDIPLTVLMTTENSMTTSAAINLATGIKPTINIPYKALWTALTTVPSDEGDVSLLTDTETPEYKDWATNKWFKFHNGGKREVILDLGDVSSVNAISFKFGQNNDAGISVPFSVRYYVSNNGIDYTFVGNARPDLPKYAVENFTGTALTAKTYKLDTVGGQPMNIQARYVKAVFYVDFHAWGDSFDVFGSKGIVNGAVVPEAQPDPDKQDAVNSVPQRGSAEAAEIGDEFLLYTGSYLANPDVTNWTVDKVLPIVGYMNKVGTFSDWQFENMLVLPVAAVQTPSGTAAGTADVFKNFKNTVDCDSFLNFIFKQNTQLGAVNEAARQLNKKLGTNKKVKINIAIPMIVPTSNFGDIKGDGSQLSLLPEDYQSAVSADGYDTDTLAGKTEMMKRAVDARTSAVKWYIDQVEKRFKEAGYDQLELKSYYWYHERIQACSGEEEIIQGTSQYLKSIGRYFTWIPYASQPSAFYWKELGFTSCTIQPMYIAGAKKKEVFPLTFDVARKTGVSTEIEYTSYATLSKELNFTVMDDEYGMKNSYHNYYYAGANPIVTSAYAFAPINPLESVSATNATLSRSVYDRIYQFIKGTYKPTYTVSQITTATNTANITSNTYLMLADNIVSGEYDVAYDSTKVEYVTCTNNPEGITDNAGNNFTPATVSVTDNKNGTVKVKFNILNGKALNSEIVAQDAYTNGSFILAKLVFKKKDGVKDSDISASMVMAGRDGVMINKNGQEYENWSETNIIPNSVEEKVVKARSAVGLAEDCYKAVTSTTDSIKSACEEAQNAVNQLPDGGYKERFTDRLNNIIAKAEMNTPVKIEQINVPSEFKEGSDAKITIRATLNRELFAKDTTLIVGLYDQNDRMVNMAVSTVKVKPDESVELTAVLKLPAGSGNNYKIRCFVWNTLDGMLPYSRTIEIPVVR